MAQESDSTLTSVSLSFSPTNRPPEKFGGLEVENQPRYCNVTNPAESRDFVPEIDEAGYASLIIGPSGTKTLVEIDSGGRVHVIKEDSPNYHEIGGQAADDAQNTYQNVGGGGGDDESRAHLLGSVNPYVNDGNSADSPAVAAAAAATDDTYAQVDRSKKRREQSGVYCVAEAASEQLGRPEDPGEEEEEEEDLVSRFQSFFGPGAHITADV